MEELDLRGEVCPFTFVRVKLRLEELPAGARLREWGQTVLAVGGEAGLWTVDVEKR